MLTSRSKPRRCVRVTARDFDGAKAGRSTTVTIYGSDHKTVIARLVELFSGGRSAGELRVSHAQMGPGELDCEVRDRPQAPGVARR